MRCSTALPVRKASIFLPAVQHEGRPYACGLMPPMLISMGAGIATCSFHERRIYEILETECDCMCDVVDVRRSVVCAIANRNKFIGSDELHAGRNGSSTCGGSGEFLHRTDGDSTLGLRKLTKCSECTLLRYVGYGSLGLREELLPE
jgi:hypothetical protein